MRFVDYGEGAGGALALEASLALEARGLVDVVF